MRRLDGLDNLPRDLPWPVVTVGTFDGIHVGHQCVLSEVVSLARENAGTALVITFEQPPKTLFGAESTSLITSVPHRLVLLERLGIDVCVVCEFTSDLARMSALDFARRVFLDGLGARGVVMGPGSAFGRNREGTGAFLRSHADALGLEVRSVSEATVDGEPVSSTRIRQAVLEGDFDLAARLLDRPFSVFGTVICGEGRGRELGFPTANLDLHHEIVPPDGVYVARALLDDETFPALVSIGTQPTLAHAHVGENPPTVVEIYLIDFDGQLYGRDIEAQFLKELRPQHRYNDIADLTAQMQSDLAAARDFFERD